MSKNSYLDYFFTLIISVLGNLNFHKIVSQCWQFLEQLGSSVPISWDDQVLSKAGVPNPQPWKVLGHGLLGTRLPSWRWAVSKWAKLHLYLQLLPIIYITAWALPPVRSAVALDSHRSSNPTVNCAVRDLGCVLHKRIIPEASPLTPAPSPWKHCLPWNQSLVPKRLGIPTPKNPVLHKLGKKESCHFGYSIIDYPCLHQG